MTHATPVLVRMARHTVYAASGCLEWVGSRDRAGYGRVGVGSATDGTFRLGLVHRVAYELLVAPIPAGLQIDHLCRNRSCWNPHHLEVVTSRENTLRGKSFAARHAAQTHCHLGHPFDDVNTRIRPDGSRLCRACERTRGSLRNKPA